MGNGEECLHQLPPAPGAGHPSSTPGVAGDHIGLNPADSPLQEQMISPVSALPQEAGLRHVEAGQSAEHQ